MREHQVDNMTLSLSKETLLTSDDVANLLRVSTKTLGQWRSEKRGPRHVNIAGTIRYRLADIRIFIRESLVQPARTPGLANQPAEAGKSRRIRVKNGLKEPVKTISRLKPPKTLKSGKIGILGDKKRLRK